MIEIPLSQGKVALIDDEDYSLVNQYMWHATKGGDGNYWYAIHSITETEKIRMHCLLLGSRGKGEVDHINGDGLDNRRCNLRIVTHAQNMMNQKKQTGRSSCFKGVTRIKQSNRWMTQIKINQKHIYLGYFTNEVDAAKAYDIEAIKLFGKHARLNFNDKSEKETNNQ